jgi:hypothetical protein
MKTYVLMGNDGDYEPHDFVVGVSRDRSKLEALKAQKEAKDSYLKIQWEMYDKCAKLYVVLMSEFYKQNPEPNYKDKVAHEEYIAKIAACYDINWEACMLKVTAEYGVNRNFMPEETSPENIIKYSIVEWDEL